MTCIVIAVSPSHFLRWHQQLRDALAARWPEDNVSFRLAPQEQQRASAADRLLGMERLLLLGGKPSLCDRLDPPVASDVDADIVIDLAGNQGGAGERVLRPLYDGHSTDQAAVAAIMCSAAPTNCRRGHNDGRHPRRGLAVSRSCKFADGGARSGLFAHGAAHRNGARKAATGLRPGCAGGQSPHHVTFLVAP